jgi:hypothetical protein
MKEPHDEEAIDAPNMLLLPQVILLSHLLHLNNIYIFIYLYGLRVT